MRIAGERLALERVSVPPHPAEGRSRSSHLRLIEVDAGGRITLPPRVRRRRLAGRQREALARVIAGDPVAAASVGPVVELHRGVQRP